MESALHGHEKAEPIGLEYLGAAIQRLGIHTEFRSRQELRAFAPSSSQQLALFGPTTAEYDNVVIAAKKARQDGCITVIGGFHACGAPKEVSAGPFDYVVVGEGENVTGALALRLLGGRCAEIPGDVTETPYGSTLITARRISDLDSLAWPLRLPEFLGTYNFCDFMWPPANERVNMALVLASRGCRNNCSFCASRAVWGRGVTYRSPGNVVNELRYLKERFSTNTVVFIDQSLGQDPEWTERLCGAIKRADLGMHWYHQSNLTVSHESIKAMSEAGCSKIGFGLESLSLSVMARVKPVNPLDFGRVNKTLDFCNSLGAFVKLYVIIGFPWETEADMAEYAKNIATLRANEVKISFFTPFPGTVDWDRYHHLVQKTDRSLHDTAQYPIVYNHAIPPENYFRIRQELFHAFYGSKAYLDVTARMLRDFPHYKESYREFAKYLHYFRMVTGNEEWLAMI